MPEGRQVFPELTVKENLEIGAYVPTGKIARARTLDLVFSIFPVLAERRKQLAGTMSGGEQQMLALGRGLMLHPRLLMLDEPSYGAQSHTPRNCCVRFVAGVAVGSRNTRFQIACWALPGSDFHRLIAPALLGAFAESGQ